MERRRSDSAKAARRWRRLSLDTIGRATGRGFLCVFGNSNDFAPQFVIGHGLRVAEGINPPLIRDTVIAVTDEFRRTETRLPLDRWAVESLKRISEASPGVGLPAQVAIVDDHDAIIHEADCDTPTKVCFVVDFSANRCRSG